MKALSKDQLLPVSHQAAADALALLAADPSEAHTHEADRILASQLGILRLFLLYDEHILGNAFARQFFREGFYWALLILRMQAERQHSRLPYITKATIDTHVLAMSALQGDHENLGEAAARVYDQEIVPNDHEFVWAIGELIRYRTSQNALLLGVVSAYKLFQVALS